jgi:N-acetyl-anhydromuramyl-L-alanine amidase AmpD
MKKLDINSIIQARLPATQFYAEKHDKKQIVLHHTVSNGNANNVISAWKKTPSRVGTAFIIDGEGIIHQCFSSAHWAHHLGTKLKQNKLLNQQSIAIEICSWGGLKKVGQKYYSTFGIELKENEVLNYNKTIRGFQYFQKYKPKQLESLKLLVQYLCEKYAITPKLNSDIWDINQQALSGIRGIFTHVSYRKDKSDCHPQLELRNLLNNL